jgi:hypothetical protein
MAIRIQSQILKQLTGHTYSAIVRTCTGRDTCIPPARAQLLNSNMNFELTKNVYCPTNDDYLNEGLCRNLNVRSSTQQVDNEL